MAAAVKAYEKQLESQTAKKMKQAAIYVEGEAKRNIKAIKSSEGKLIDTGRMVNSITTEVIEKGDTVDGFVGTNVEYAKYHEKGTSTIPPRPFLRPALVDNRDAVKKILAQGLNDAARKVDKS